MIGKTVEPGNMKAMEESRSIGKETLAGQIVAPKERLLPEVKGTFTKSRRILENYLMKCEPQY